MPVADLVEVNEKPIRGLLFKDRDSRQRDRHAIEGSLLLCFTAAGARHHGHQPQQSFGGELRSGHRLRKALYLKVGKRFLEARDTVISNACVDERYVT